MKIPPEMDKQIVMIQENMLKLYVQIHKIVDAKNQQEREWLRQAHQEKIHEPMLDMKAGKMSGGDAKKGE